MTMYKWSMTLDSGSVVFSGCSFSSMGFALNHAIDSAMKTERDTTSRVISIRVNPATPEAVW